MRVNIDAERVRNRFSKEELTKRLGISTKTYYNWVNEKTDIPGTKLMELSRLFGVPMEYLLESQPEEKGA